MSFKKLGKDWSKQQAEKQAERERAAQDPGPALEAIPVEGMHDWTKKLGVLYGTPAKLHDGWGVTICPTRQQDALIERRRLQYQESGAYDDGYMVGLPAASIDKTGHVRELTIREASRGWRYDMDGNIQIDCGTEARNRDAEPELKPMRKGGDPTTSTARARPTDAVRLQRTITAARSAPSPARS